MQNINLNEPDKHIVDELSKIQWPIINKEGTPVYLRERRGDINNTINHIAKKSHYLKIRDIKVIKSIIANPLKVINKDSRQRKIYFGNRPGDPKGNNNEMYLQITVEVYEGREYISTIYPRKTPTEKSHFY